VANLLNSLLSSASALGAYDQVLQVTQNNVANASTPGYVKHRQVLLAMSFDPAGGLAGGVRAGEVQSARSDYADQSVRRQLLDLGQAQQNVATLQGVQSAFDISGDSGIPGALNTLFQSFSAWAQSPGDSIARQSVIDRANDVGTAFQQTAANLVQTAQDTERAAHQTVDTINTVVGQLRTLNQLARQSAGKDAGVDAQIHASLEELSTYINFVAVGHDDGSVSVLMNGQTPLLLDDQQYRISCKLGKADTPPPVYEGAPGSLQIIAGDGTDITAATNTGQLGALLDARNRVLPSYLGDSWQQGGLNRLATQFADRVNQLFTSGVVNNDTPPQAGVALFQYDANPTDAARTLTVDQSVKPESLAAIDTGPPPVSNGIALALSKLASPLDAADRIDGSSYTQFYGALAGSAGAAWKDADARLTMQQSAVAQAKNLREQMSGVSLDEEATILIQFQRAYEANSRLISVLNQLTEDTLNILQP
jgi:flagellar hook-associated protein 1